MSDDVAGLTLDTGALIEIAKSLTTKRGANKTARRVVAVWKDALDRKAVVTVPTLVFAGSGAARPAQSQLSSVACAPTR